MNTNELIEKLQEIPANYKIEVFNIKENKIYEISSNLVKEAPKIEITKNSVKEIESKRAFILIN